MKRLPAAWQPSVVAALILLTLLSLLFGGSAVDMFEIWMRSETFAHAFVVPPISIWLIWRNRAEWLQQAPRLWWPGLLLLAAGALAWMAAWLGSANVVMQFSFVFMLIAVLLASFGPAVCKAFAFALGFLFFAVPAGEFMLPTLMSLTADFTVVALRFTGIPVYREGLSFVIPSGSWSVVEACSGIRYLIASVMVGTLFAYLNFNSLRRRMVFIAVATFLPLLANWVRAYLIVMIGHLSNNQLATGVDHIVYGWVFFGIIMLGMFSIGARFADPVPDPVPPRPMPDLPRQMPGVATLLLALLVGGGMAGLKQWSERIAARPLSGGDVSLVPADFAAQGWRPVANSLGWTPKAESPNAEQLQCYAKGEQSACLYLAYYRNQAGERRLLGMQSIVPGGGEHGPWTLLGSRAHEIDLAGSGVSLELREIRGARDWAALEQPRLLVAQTFWVNGRLMRSETRGKLYGALDRLFGRGDDAALLLVFMPMRQGENTQQLLDGFLKNNLTGWAGQLAQTKARAEAAGTNTMK
ncbi:exosortase A [Paucibacter sp. APW11]|uniref:Exosortase A n=1 Tax=Roseateles aquae TaxID=3077235 RepID=A0ABU3P5U6_9BURK|nr:exosortase A [Paucibacter sp. APW11]MDT8997945.1 exosortase A [Paucibacter sp. APW11]